MKKIVVIPVYKKSPSEEELKSLRQCIRILGRHDLCLIGPESLDLTRYERIFHEERAHLPLPSTAGCGQTGKLYLTEHFDDSFFAGQRGYNRLMLTRQFYERFAQWDYMLIYQLDAYVFSDQLDEWCRKGYDYVGAPFLKLDKEVDPLNSGNGGFSLRRIPAFIHVFSSKGRVLHAKGLWRFYRYRGPLHRLPLTLLGIFGYRNRLKDFLSGERVNEDLFYAMLGDSALKWRVATTPEAMFFAFEGRPSFLFSRTRQLPFGCHAYMENEYETFYKPYIEGKEEASHD